MHLTYFGGQSQPIRGMKTMVRESVKTWMTVDLGYHAFLGLSPILTRAI